MSGEIIFPNSPPLPIVKQPNGDYAWIAEDKNTFTKFGGAMTAYGTTAYMAHSYGAGKYLSSLNVGDTIGFKFGDYKRGDGYGKKVTEIHRFQALEPKNVRSDFVDLDTGDRHTYKEISKLMYGDKNKIVLQTCIEKDKDKNWGRMFVITE